jgi:hypothetical protein
MPLWKQRLLARVQAPQGGDGGDGGGGSGDGDGGAGDGEGGDDDGGDGEGGDDDATADDKGKPPAKKPAKKAGGMSDDNAKLLKENMRRKDELKAANNEIADLKSKLEAFNGLDPAELRAMIADRRTAEEKALAEKGEWDKLKARMAGEHKTQMDQVNTAVTSLKGELQKAHAQIDELTVGQAFAQSTYIREETVYTPTKMRKVYGDHVDRVDGEIVVYDKPRGAAGRTALVDQYGSNLAFEEAIAKLVEADPDRETILKSKVKNGSGSGSGTPAQRRAPSKEDTPKTGQQKIAAGLKALGL